MRLIGHAEPLTWPFLAWLSALLAGALLPGMALVLLVPAAASETGSLVSFGPAMIAVGVMGAGMIGAAAAGRFAIGLVLALLAGGGLLLLSHSLGMPTLSHPLQTVPAIAIASLSFAARGALFARSALGKGWWIALFVVIGEAAILVSAALQSDAIPDWLLVLLPAQWTNMALQGALSGTVSGAAGAALLALGGTAAATMTVTWLWPRRWPYLIMFTTWLSLSALVYHHLTSSNAEHGPVHSKIENARLGAQSV